MRHFLLFTAVFFTISCSVIPYGPKSSDVKKGYWSKKIQNGIHKVYANYDRSSSPKRAMGYIIIRGFELCKKEGKNYFSVGIVSEHSKFDYKTVSANIYCRKSASRFGLTAGLVGNTTRVDKSGKKSELRAKDTILSMNKKRVTSRNDIDNFLYNLRSSKKNMSVIVERKGKKKKLLFKPQVRKDVLTQKDVVATANQWSVPLNSIKGI